MGAYDQKFESRWMASKENLFGQSMSLMNATYIAFP